jgi:hypothetical protein
MTTDIDSPTLRLPSTVAAAGLRVGDEVIVVHVPSLPATKSLAGRRGKLLVLDRARTIAGVRLDGVMHAMHASCLRRSDDAIEVTRDRPRESPVVAIGSRASSVRRDDDYAA